MYVPVPFPSWRYHKSQPARIVQTQADSDALGPEWADSPAAFAPKPAVPHVPAKNDLPESVPEKHDQAAELHGTKAPEVIAAIEQATDLHKLTELDLMERAHPTRSGGRRMVLKAIEDRIAALAAKE